MNPTKTMDQAMGELLVESKWAGKGKSITQLLQAAKKYEERTDKTFMDFTPWLPSLGKVLGKIYPGEFFVILSDTGSGKTVMLQQIMLKIAASLKILFFELELPDIHSLNRFIGMKQMESPSMARDVILDENRWPSIQQAYGHVTTYSEMKFSIQDIEEIIDYEKPQLVIVDYVGLVRHAGKTRYEKLSDIAEELKLVASVKNVILIVACQIARKEKGALPEIFLHDAKDSGSIENSAMKAIGMWREGAFGEDVKIKVLKNQGDRDLTFSYRFNRESLNIWAD